MNVHGNIKSSTNVRVRSTPEYKAWRSAYRRPENLERKRLYDKEYRKRRKPQTAAQKKAKAQRMRLWYQKNKQEENDLQMTEDSEIQKLEHQLDEAGERVQNLTNKST